MLPDATSRLLEPCQLRSIFTSIGRDGPSLARPVSRWVPLPLLLLLLPRYIWGEKGRNTTNGGGRGALLCLVCCVVSRVKQFPLLMLYLARNSPALASLFFQFTFASRYFLPSPFTSMFPSPFLFEQCGKHAVGASSSGRGHPYVR